MPKYDLPKSPGRFILYFGKRYTWHCLALAAISVFWAVDLSLRPYLIKVMLDSVETASHTDSLFRILLLPTGGYIFLGFLSNALFRIFDYVSLKFLPHIWEDISIKSLEHTQKHSHSFFQNHFGGSIVAKISELATAVQNIIDVFINRFFSHTVALLIACYTMSLVNPYLSLILIVWFVIFSLGSYHFMKKTHQLSIAATEAQTSLIGKIIDSISNMLTVRLFAREKFEISFIASQVRERTKRGERVRWSNLKQQAFMETASNILIGLLLCYLIYARQRGEVSIGDFALILTLSVSISDSVWNIARDFLHFSEDLGKMSQTLSLVVQKHEIIDAPEAPALSVTEGCIIYETVTFGYNKKTNLFKNLSVEIPSEQKVGLVGFSGSGKTTFVNLITRLYDVQEGKILIDNQEIAKVTQNSLHENISFIPQDPTLFHRTIFENIGYGKITATREEVIEAAIKAHAHEFISSLPQTYETLVGERGIKLSGGQRQRIAIARAFLKNAKILILDEATSALDSLTEYYIQESLKTLMKDKTVIVIAHRLSTLLDMDRIIVFEQGKIIEDGSHDLLLKQGSTYAKLWSMQGYPSKFS